MLFVERHAVGVIEAKPEGTTFSGVSEQTEKYLRSFPENVPHVGDFFLLPMRALELRLSLEMFVIRIAVPTSFCFS